MAASISQSGGLEEIVHDCLRAVAAEKNLPNPVLRRLTSLADSVASGELDPSDKIQMERRVELVIKGFDPD